MHAGQRTFVAPGKKGYTILWATPEAEWAAGEESFRQITSGFRPAAPPEPTPSASRAATPSTAPTTARPPSALSPTPTPKQSSPGVPDVPGTQLVGRASARCVDVADPDSPDPVALRIWDCGASRARDQTWTFQPDGSITLLGRCMDVLNASDVDGATIQLTTCNTTPAQKFILDGEQHLVNASSGKCVGVAESGTENGALLQQFTCGSASDQAWSKE
ncbi:ricin-type beta-trefoil lectin domain protein [Rugosimonospora acidiphila]